MASPASRPQARPLSEQKRDAILDAAAKLVAQMGTGAPTAKIAKAAGVSEGTLFTYFATKDDLLNKLFVEIETGLADMLASHPPIGSPRESVRQIWDKLIDWGVANQRKALRQLKMSERVSGKSRRRCDVMFQEARRTYPARARFFLHRHSPDGAGRHGD